MGIEVNLDELRIIAGEQKFNLVLLEKDYLLTHLLYLIKDVDGIYFKGGTALNKIFLDHERLSEDLDFTLTKKLSVVEKEIREKLKGTIFKKITHDKRVDKFVRLIVHYQLFHEKGTIFIDLNERAKLSLKPQKIKLPHFYKNVIPNFEVNCLNEKEIVAEKIKATIQRYKPRDYFDLYYIIKKKIPMPIGLVKQKFKEDGKEFSKELLFKKANKVFKKWDKDLSSLTKTTPKFIVVIKTLQKSFKYKEKQKEGSKKKII